MKPHELYQSHLNKYLDYQLNPPYHAEQLSFQRGELSADLINKRLEKIKS